MAIVGDMIYCDRFGCRTGREIPPDGGYLDQLGWRLTERDGRTFHHCPLHFGPPPGEPDGSPDP